MGESFTPQPTEPGMRVRLKKNGPWVDLGISQSRLIVGLLDTVSQLCDYSGAARLLSDDLRTALNNVNVHRGGKP